MSHSLFGIPPPLQCFKIKTQNPPPVYEAPKIIKMTKKFSLDIYDNFLKKKNIFHLNEKLWINVYFLNNMFLSSFHFLFIAILFSLPFHCNSYWLMMVKELQKITEINIKHKHLDEKLTFLLITLYLWREQWFLI